MVQRKKKKELKEELLGNCFNIKNVSPGSKSDRGAVADLEEQILSREIVVEPVDFISTGSTNLNFAGSGKGKDGGWARGRVVNVVGDGSSGKTLAALELCAICHYTLMGRKTKNFPEIKKVDICYLNGEQVMDFKVNEMYDEGSQEGKGLNETIEWITDIDTVEGFGRDLKKRLDKMKSGHFMLYVVDSFDSLVSEEEKKRFEEAAKKNKKEEGSYNLEKQKYTSMFFRNIVSRMQGKDCLLFIISQTRVRIGVTFGKKKYRTGGDALNFYTHQVCWLAEIERLSRTVQGEKVTYGIRVRGKFERNKTAKPYREGEFIILFDYGIDDVGSMVRWLWGSVSKEVEWLGKTFPSY